MARSDPRASIRVIAILILMPWTYWRFRRCAAQLFERHGHQFLMLIPARCIGVTGLLPVVRLPQNAPLVHPVASSVRAWRGVYG